MENLNEALAHFANTDSLEKSEFEDGVWQKGRGPAIALLKKYGMVYAHSAAEEDYPIVGDLTARGKEARDKLFKK